MNWVKKMTDNVVEIKRSKQQAIIFDIDGTLSDVTHRRPLLKDNKWTDFFDAMGDDPLVEPVAEALYAHMMSGMKILICTGRPEDYKDLTVDWLNQHNLSYHALHMRPKGDYRADTIVKKEMLDELSNEYDILCVYDDRQSVVDMWRENGVTCFQVNEGDFDKKKYEQGTLTLLVGPSGAGKSHTTQETDALVISSDGLRQNLCGDFKDQSKNNQVFTAMHAIIKTALDNGVHVIADATHVRDKDRRTVRDLADEDTEIRYEVYNRPMEEKVRDGGWRNDVIVKNKPLMEYHEDIFNSNLENILAGDNDPRVTVIDMRTYK